MFYLHSIRKNQFEIFSFLVLFSPRIYFIDKLHSALIICKPDRVGNLTFADGKVDPKPKYLTFKNYL